MNAVENIGKPDESDDADRENEPAMEYQKASRGDSIVGVEVFVSSPTRNYVTLRITTRDGLVGLGDATVNGRELAVASYLREHVAPMLLGRDPSQIEDIWQLLYRGVYWRRGAITMACVGAVDVALWDILGHRTGQPLYNLLGGRVRDRLLTYRHAFGWDVPSLLQAVDRELALGFKAIRVQSGVPGLDTVYGVSAHATYEPAAREAGPAEERWDTGRYLRHVPSVLDVVRSHVGPDVELLHDAHHRLSPIQAARLARELEDVNLFWLEDPTPAEDPAAIRTIREHSVTPLAIGEVFNSGWDAQQLITERLIDYVRTAVVHAGGVSHMRKIAAMASFHGVKMAPHGPSDVSPISLAASIHLGMATHNFAIQEYMGYADLVHEVFPHAFRVVDGYLDPGDTPGLGVDFNEGLSAEHPYVPAYLPVARAMDGTMTDW